MIIEILDSCQYINIYPVWSIKNLTKVKVILNFSKRLHIGLLNQASGSNLNLGEYWYFVSKIVLTYCEKKCSIVQEKLGKCEAEGQEVAKFLRSLEQLFKQWKVGTIFGNRMTTQSTHYHLPLLQFDDAVLLI